MGHPVSRGCRIVYVSPLKALAVDVERNLRSPLAGMANMARRMGVPFREPPISVRTGDTPQRERARFARHPAEILITTPESLYLLLTSQAAEALRTVDTVIMDEIHALVPTKRGAHLALTLERLQALTSEAAAAHRAFGHAAAAGRGGAISGRGGSTGDKGAREQGSKRPGTRDQGTEARQARASQGRLRRSTTQTVQRAKSSPRRSMGLSPSCLCR